MAHDAMRAGGASAAKPSARFLTRAEAAEYLGETWGIRRSPKTLQKLASIGGGPVFRKIGRQPVYTPRDLDRWAKAAISPPVARARDLRQPACA